MALAYADAVAALYRSSQELFVTERKRLAAELKTGGDKEGAARLGKLARPTLSAWAVNQLWWQAQPLFELLLSSSERLRRGDRSANTAHRDALSALRTRAAALLAEGGHAATDATLRRVTTTLSALAAAGGFEPEAPGALSADRDPPGFEAMDGFEGFGGAPVEEREADRAAKPDPPPEPPLRAEPGAAAEADRAGVVAAEAERQATARREREARARQQKDREDREQREREQQQTRGALSRARTQLTDSVASVERCEAELARAREGAERAQAIVAELEQKLRRLEQGES